jgi:hypothetical protein
MLSVMNSVFAVISLEAGPRSLLAIARLPVAVAA